MSKYSATQAKEVEELVKPTYAKLKVWAHGWIHVENVAKAAEDLAKMEGVDPILCRIAAYCHDLGRLEEERKGLVKPTPGTPSPHGGFGVRPTREILQKVGISCEDIDAVVEAVQIHNQKKYLGENKIAIILQDADRSDGFGKLAILRFAAFNCEMPVSEPRNQEDIDREFEQIKTMLRGKKDWRDRMVNVLRYVLRWIDELANTKSLNKYVEGGYAFNKKFLEEIESY